jgi:phosphoenolpyruvate carboxylase
MEIYTTATLEAWLLPPSVPRAEWRDCMDRLAADARTAFRQVVYDDPRFLDYFHSATPVDELGAMNIGSRPARRGKDASIGGLRAIPWQFAWTQTRLMLGAWLGIEQAIDAAFARGEGLRLREMHREWPFFRSVIDLMEMVLAKADAHIAAEYDRQLVPPHLRPIGHDLRTRLERAIRGVLNVTEHARLVEENPVLRRSIDVRNPYVDPINLVQVELLSRWRRTQDPHVHAGLLVTLNGVAAGLRNTG